MSEHEQIRLLMAVILGAILAVIVYVGAFNKSKTVDDSFVRSSRYDPILSPTQLVLVLAFLIACSFLLGFQCEIFSLFLQLIIELAVYFAMLLALLPLLRKVIRPGTVAALWLLPNVLYFTCYAYMQPSRPVLVLPISLGSSLWLPVIWGVGFLAVMVRAIAVHLTYRKQLLRGAVPVAEPEILAMWEEEKATMSLEKYKLPLGRSADTATPLSIGLWPRTTHVVLPLQDYTADELRLIFRHELIHIRRQDPAAKLFLTLCQAACWFNPLMWIAMRRCAEDLELGCDELVLTVADSATRETYARLVLRTAGDERGFTTCLSAKARSLRYRLQGIVTERKRLAGGLLVGILVVVLLMCNGLVAFAYAPSRGEDAIFRGRSADCEPENIYTLPDAKWHPFQYDFYTCKNPSALRQYLAELELYHISGLYDPRDDYLCVSYSDVSVRLYDRMIQVTRFLTPTETETQLFYCPQGVDLDRLISLLEEMP